MFGLPIYIDIFEFLLFFIENLKYIVAVNLLILPFVKPGCTRYLVAFAIPLALVIMTAATAYGSYEDAALRGYDMAGPSLREALEHYIETGQGAVVDILEAGKYPPTFGKHEMTYLLKDLFAHTLFHTDSHNSGNIAEGYNKGDDWFAATLGEPMVYTSGIYKTGSETLMQAQQYKMDYVANAINLQEGENVLDIGCGWGPLVKHMTEKYGAKVTGLTLSKGQHKWTTSNFNRDNGAKVLLQDAMAFEKERPEDIPEGGFDKITSLEMAEHVGIHRYQEFLGSVRSMLKDTGTFYLQVAGLRRKWDYEDLVWGLFMGEHVFPGADASCPIGWVTTQVERAGFEVQRVSNLGNHYSRTLDHWLDEWKLAKDSIIAAYGEQSWRRWEVFLAWSVRVARQGSSTVFMLTLTKAGQNPVYEATRIAAQDHLVPKF
jgi:cyclopropane fatty-acyl-phospholipid synthase-like methyltransferase